MPSEVENPYPITTATEVAAAPGDQAVKAARNIMTRYMDGMIPRRGFLLGQNDGSTIMRGVTDLTAACYKLLGAIPPGDHNGSLAEAAIELEAILEQHGCPDEEGPLE